MEGRPKEMLLTIKDDGQGFSPALVEQRRDGGRHFGLGVMQERAESLGGRLSVVSAPGQGTEIKLVLPLKGKGKGRL